jgi:hypothetical protein
MVFENLLLIITDSNIKLILGIEIGCDVVCILIMITIIKKEYKELIYISKRKNND